MWKKFADPLPSKIAYNKFGWNMMKIVRLECHDNWAQVSLSMSPNLNEDVYKLKTLRNRVRWRWPNLYPTLHV